MYKSTIIEPIGFILAGITLVFSLFLFYSDTTQFMGSLMAALLAAALVWVTYIILRWVLLAIRK